MPRGTSRTRHTAVNAEIPEDNTQPITATPERGDDDRSAEPGSDESFFFDRIAAITDAEWESRYVAYLYMIAPKIALPGDRHHVGKLNARFDEADILARYGSGQYQVRLNDKKARKTVATHLFNVYDPKKAPYCDPSLIVDCPENQPYLKWIQNSQASAAATEESKRADDLGDTPRKSKAPSVSEELLLGMAQGRDALASKLAEVAKQQPNIDPIAALTQAVDLVRSLQPQADSGKTEASSLERAINLLAKLHPPASPAPTLTELVTLAEKLNPQRPKTESDDPIATLEKVLNISERIRPAQQESTPAAAAGSEWASILAAVQPSLTALIANFPQVVTGFKLAMGGNPLRQNAPQPPAGFRPTQPHAAASPGAGVDSPPSAVTPNVSAAMPPAEPLADPQPMLTAEQENLKRQVQDVLRQVTPTMLFHFNNHFSGVEFAEHVLQSGLMFNGMMVPGDVALQLARQIGKENLIGYFRTNSALWVQLAPTPETEGRFTKFVEDFLTYESEPLEEDEEDAPTAEATGSR